MKKSNSTSPLKKDAEASVLTDKKQWLFMALFVVIAAVSIWAVMSQSESFSLAEFVSEIKNASLPWLLTAVLSMLGFIMFEALAILVLCRAFGYKQGLWRGHIYSSSDIYFSAITPSATGGQPASAYFMIKDGMSGTMVTALLIANLCMYTLAIIVIGTLCFILRFDMFLSFSLPSQILILAGFAVQIGLLLFFYMVLKKDHLLQRICNAVLSLLCKLRILRNQEKKKAKLDAYMDRYRQHSHLLVGRTKPMLLCFVFNFLQRLSQIAVTMFVYAATTGQNLWHSIELLFCQGYVVLGSNLIPIPGAQGVSDYLMIDGFTTVMSGNEADAVHLELLSRSISFYLCVIICGISTLVQYFVIKKRRK